MNPLLDCSAHPVIGHRGAAWYAPENTLESFRLALAQGADAIEFDIRRSADGEAMVFHDALLDRTTDQQGPVAARTTAELQRLEWTPLPGEDIWYDVYRGDLATLATGSYDHRAIPGGCVVPSASLDVADLPDGASRYYLVAATNLAEEGTLGSGAAGPRPRGVPSCP